MVSMCTFRHALTNVGICIIRAQTTAYGLSVAFGPSTIYDPLRLLAFELSQQASFERC